jgi:uncharacterized peroxidase-related enzyme
MNYSITDTTDWIDNALGCSANDPLYALRRQREKVIAASQGSYDAIFNPHILGISIEERWLVAHAVATLTGCTALAELYAKNTNGIDLKTIKTRQNILLEYVEILTLRPAEGDQKALNKLISNGFSVLEIVMLAQLIGFVAYQARVVMGLKAITHSPSKLADNLQSEDSNFTHPAHLSAPKEVLRIQGFTSETLGWKAWLPVLDLSQATEHQLAVLKASHPSATSSDYYLTLIQHPHILEERSAAFNAIMYAPGGLSRAERELASTVVSRINGCVYCAAVHAQRFEQLTKRNDVIAQVFSDPVTAGTNNREKAIVKSAIVLTQSPETFNTQYLADFNPQEAQDLVHAIALFAWANRLMLNLGEPLTITSQK